MLYHLAQYLQPQPAPPVVDAVPLAPREVLQSSLDKFQALASSKGLRLSGHCTPEVPDWWTGDPVRLRQILGNLISNALKFTERGRITVHAGTMPLAFFADHAAARDAWDRCIDVNIKGVVHGISAVYDHMVERGRGHVVNISSIYGNFPNAGAAVYSATKAAVNVLSEALRVESQGVIKVTTIKPTGVPATRLGASVVNPEATIGIDWPITPAFWKWNFAFSGSKARGLRLLLW